MAGTRDTAGETWLVTGGAGFIGNAFVRLAAAETGARLVVLDALTYAARPQALARLVHAGRIEMVVGDVADTLLVDRLFEERGFHRVVHLAAESHVDRSIAGPRPFMRTNVEGTLSLLMAAQRHWADRSSHLFVQISTDEVFGALGPDDPPAGADSPYRPNSPYAASKAAADHLVRAWQETYGLPAVISHCTNNYGPWQHREKLIPLILANALAGEPLPVYGDGQQVRDWLHVEDHVAGLLQVALHARPGERFLFAGGEPWRNLDLVRAICECVDARRGCPPGETARLIRHVEDRPGHDRRYALDDRPTRARLGWAPARRLRPSLDSLVQQASDANPCRA